jgi:hypothetical protein
MVAMADPMCVVTNLRLRRRRKGEVLTSSGVRRCT